MNGCLHTTSAAIRTVDWSGDTGNCWACSKARLIRRRSSWKAVMRSRNPMRRKTKLNKPSEWRKRGGRVSQDKRYYSALIERNLSRLNHRLPRGETHPEVRQGTAEFHHEIGDAFFPQADAVFDDATTLDTPIDMLDPQPTLVQRLVRP